MQKTFIFLFLILIFLEKNHAQGEVIGMGQRWQLSVTNISIIENHRSNVLMQMDISNSGKEDIELPYNPSLSSVEVVFEDTLKKSQYAYFQHLIKEQLKDEDLFLPVGLVKESFQLEILLPKTHIEKHHKKADKTKIQKDSVVTKKEITTSDSLLIKKDSIVLTTDSLIVKVKKDSLALNIQPKSDSVTITKIIDENICQKPDFVIDSVQILKKTSKNILLRALIKNKGIIPVQLLGESPSISDNIAVKAYFSSFPKYTNGAIFIRGIYIDKEAQSIENQLHKENSLWVAFEIPLKNKTRFTPHLVLEINGNSTVEECTSENNFISVKID